MKPLAPLPAAPRLTPSEQRYPLYSFRVPAGFPSPAQDHIENTLSLDELMSLRAPHVYLVRAQGDSMTGAGIFDGDILVVDRAAEAANGAVVIAALNGEPLVPLTADERAIVEGDMEKLDDLIRKLDCVPTLDGRTPCEIKGQG